ncbi:tryptophan synthase subunit beta [Corynebacterium sp. 320]|uniref:Tryptophan synthase beta chain n=1 Tax=Corynebacterium zhongnanshanii TaxID=2768834 RepID=A0ABQ6VD84_9CORY|nr:MULTISPECIES: tryptophan synthase subunit beta [Corynebacterium]KAB1502542.1 tryptophan synthase subunit beta [Corynebacterium sp. 320]KAB1551935.1 tryptophan synthase subunit beta [Corynebacterium sp. 319]KAB3520776.1 tryptophan synthase subunit beta [Corynebacterium zhongnanshanii]KAB3526149.1 tryptophan synthase subunit beta [Corynebacterium sp. 250]KAB3538929.1 tryptophan synthase subunit beta [Corynebacterium sp. 366]
MNNESVTLPTVGEVLATPTHHEPDDRGHWGEFGGRYVPEALMAVIDEITDAWNKAKSDQTYLDQLDELHRTYTGRPSPLYFAPNFSSEVGAKVWLKREDLNHTGSHKINNVLGQVLLAKRMGKRQVIAETGAGQHGVATATACALLDLDCRIYMGEVDANRQALNIARMRLLGATVEVVKIGSRTLKDAINEAMRYWVSHADDTYYAFGTAAGPHPFPQMVRDLQRIIGVEARQQILDETGKLPDSVIACVGGGSNAIGLFHRFISDEGVKLIGAEAAGDGVETGRHAAPITVGSRGVFQGAYADLMQNEDGQIIESHSISAGLDYPGVGPEHSRLHSEGRAEYLPITDTEAMDAFRQLSMTEGIIPAIESAHAVAAAVKVAKREPGSTIIVNISGRGDKDVATANEWFGLTEGEDQ